MAASDYASIQELQGAKVDVNNLERFANDTGTFTTRIGGVTVKTLRQYTIDFDGEISNAQAWASETDSPVVSSPVAIFSAKEYAQGSQSGTGGSAKAWASSDEDVEIDGTGLFSAKHYAIKAQASLDAFEDVYLGRQASDPTTDLNGNPLNGGEFYVNSGTNKVRIYDGSSWSDALDGVTEGFSGEFTGDPTFSGSPVFSGAFSHTGSTVTITDSEAWRDALDGHWYTPEMFGAIGDGAGDGTGTNDATALQNALNAINAAGGGTLYLINRYRCDSQLAVYSNTRIVAANAGAGIDAHNLGSSGALFIAAGTVSNNVVLAANASKFDKSVTVAAGAETPFAVTSGLAVGALIRIYSDEIWYDAAAAQGSSGVAGTPSNVFHGEYNWVRDTSSGSITLNNPLREDYATADTATIEIINPVRDIVIDGGVYYAGNTPSTNNADTLLQVTWGENIIVRNVSAYRFDATTISYRGCVNSKVLRSSFYDLRSSVGYGVGYANSQQIEIDGCFFIRCRHATSGVSGSFSGNRGINRDIAITNFFMNASAPAYSGDTETSPGDCLDFHGGCQGVHVENGWIIGASGNGIIAECPDVSIRNVRIFGSGTSGISAYNRAHVDGDLLIENVHINGFSSVAGGWAGIDVDFGWSDLSGTYSSITIRGGTIRRSGIVADVEEIIHLQRTTGTNTCATALIALDEVAADGSVGRAMDFDRIDNLRITGSYTTNSAGSDGWRFRNCGRVEIDADITATSAGSHGMLFTAVTDAACSGNWNLSGAAADGVDFATTNITTDSRWSLNASSAGEDGIFVSGASRVSLSGYANCDDCTSDGATLNNITSLFYDLKMDCDAAGFGLRVIDCPDAVFSGGWVKKDADNTTPLSVLTSDRAKFLKGFRVITNIASSFGVLVDQSAYVYWAASVEGPNFTRALELSDADNATVESAFFYRTSGSGGIAVKILATTDAATVRDITTIGFTTIVDDSGTNTVYQPASADQAAVASALTENGGAIGGTNDGDLPSLTATAVQLTDSTGGIASVSDTLVAIGAAYVQGEVADNFATLAREVERLRSDSTALRASIRENATRANALRTLVNALRSALVTLGLIKGAA